MSVSVTRDGELIGELCSNRGWGDLGRWVDSLDAVHFAEVARLWEHGWSEDALALASQIGAALAVSPPPLDVRAVAVALGEFANNSSDDAVLTVSEGFAPDVGLSP